jgi:hypothetical protein
MSGARFAGFGPYVPSASDSGVIAFQAALAKGGSGVFCADGGETLELTANCGLREVTSHPDIDRDGVTSFYAVSRDGRSAALRLDRGALTTLAATGETFLGIGPAGPTMNNRGSVAFRASTASGGHGVFVAHDTAVAAVAEVEKGWAGFHGLPVVDDLGTVVFRADRSDGSEGIYASGQGCCETIAETGGDLESLGRFPCVSAPGIVMVSGRIRGVGDAVLTLADGGLTIIETPGAFETIRGVLAAASGAIVRIATPHRGRLGLFDGPDPVRDAIVAIGDDVLDSSVTDLAANPVSINAAGRLAIWVRLADGREAILGADPVD